MNGYGNITLIQVEKHIFYLKLIIQYFFNQTLKNQAYSMNCYKFIIKIKNFKTN